MRCTLPGDRLRRRGQAYASTALFEMRDTGAAAAETDDDADEPPRGDADAQS